MFTNLFRTFVAFSVLLATLILPTTSFAQAQEVATSPQQNSSWPKLTITVDPPTLRTPSDEDDSKSKSARRKPIPFRPTMDTELYVAAKQAAAHQVVPPPIERPEPDFQISAQPVPISSFEGVDQATAGGLFPPDTHGAVGRDYFVEVTNSHLDIFTKSGIRVRSISLNNFFQYFNQTLFDPRVVYDAIFDRWVIIAPALRESGAVQRFFIAASTGPDPLGSYFFYNLNVTRNFGDFFDYPQLGLHSNAVIVTANIFPASGAVYANVYTIPINRLYSGGSLIMAQFTNLPGSTIAPPVVLDTNPNAFLVSAPPQGSALNLYRLSNLLIPSSTTLNGPFSVAVPFYSVPPDAQQPSPCTGATNNLDTLDSRFVNASTQSGDSLWQVHTVTVNTSFGPRPRPKFYQINTVINRLMQSGSFSATQTSYDFNASIAANSGEDVFVTWSGTDPSRGVNAQVLVSGRRASDPFNVIPSGLPVATSQTCITGNFDSRFGTQRWGDYSAVTVDPTDSLTGWIVNEKINSTTQWGSRIGKVIF